MKKALILYWHGLGDVVLLTPHLRHLYKQGYMIDLMCRPQVRQSKLLDACPYINKLIDVPNPWEASLGFDFQADSNMTRFHALKDKYDWSGASPHQRPFKQYYKLDITSYELGIDLEDKHMEVFISEEAEAEAKAWVDEFVGDYIFVHRISEFHEYHSWDCRDWVKENLPATTIVYSDIDGKIVRFDDINTIFAIARNAKHRVLISSVFVSACEAMSCTIDAINYGQPDRKLWPLDQHKVLHIREQGVWIK